MCMFVMWIQFWFLFFEREKVIRESQNTIDFDWGTVHIQIQIECNLIIGKLTRVRWNRYAKDTILWLP